MQECQLLLEKWSVEKVIELELSDDEKDQFNKSIKAVQELFDSAKKIDKNLEK